MYWSAKKPFQCPKTLQTPWDVSAFHLVHPTAVEDQELK